MSKIDVILVIIFIIINFMLYDLTFKRIGKGIPFKDANTRKCAVNMVLSSMDSSIDSNVIRQYVIKFHGIHGLPSIKFKHMASKLLPCLNYYPLFFNNHMKHAMGYVVPNYSKKHIYINDDYWKELPIQEKSILLIHECTHLMLETYDYAYMFEDHYWNLRGKRARFNADTITGIINDLNEYKC